MSTSTSRPDDKKDATSCAKARRYRQRRHRSRRSVLVKSGKWQGRWLNLPPSRPLPIICGLSKIAAAAEVVATSFGPSEKIREVEVVSLQKTVAILQEEKAAAEAKAAVAVEDAVQAQVVVDAANWPTRGGQSLCQTETITVHCAGSRGYTWCEGARSVRGTSQRS